MVHISARQMAEVGGAAFVDGPQGAFVDGVTIDSRTVYPGAAFVAIAGQRVDGNDYARMAIESGASAVVMTRDPDEAVLAAAREHSACVLTCEDGQAFLWNLARWWRDTLQCAVVGVTGSSGKSTTKEMCARVLSTTYKTHATRGNLNNELGAPLTVLACPTDAEALVVEMGMSDLHEIEAIAQMAKPHIGIVTNVGVAHIGILGSRDNIARAKSELVASLPPTDTQAPYPSCAVLCGQDDYTAWMRSEVAEPAGVRTLTFGTSFSDDCRCTDAVLDMRGCANGRVHLPSGAEFDLRLLLPGAHNVTDALAAATVGDLLGVTPDNIAKALSQVQPMRMHQQVIEAPAGFTVIDDSYNANADSMRVAIDALCARSCLRRIACLGDMGELGEFENVLHAAVGAYAAAKGIDVLVCVGELSRATAYAARAMGMASSRVFEVEDANGAGELLKSMLEPGDTLLVKASRSTGLDATVEAVMRS